MKIGHHMLHLVIRSRPHSLLYIVNGFVCPSKNTMIDWYCELNLVAIK